jgi:acyl phosphate:glycerol-3-phosphate acyltransferase
LRGGYPRAVDLGTLAWSAGAYLAGTFPSTWIVARARHATALLSAATRDSGETDAHILMTKYLGVGWTALAATFDVLKGLVYVLVARHVGHLNDSWLALVGVLIVVGHTFPFFARQMAGRGLAGAAGVFLVLLPLQMTIAGIVIVIGGATHNTSLSSTIGMGSVPVISAIQGQPGSFVAMSMAIFAILMIRRLEGVGSVIRSGVPPSKAVLYRTVFDSSGPPARPVRQVGEEDLPRS